MIRVLAPRLATSLTLLRVFKSSLVLVIRATTGVLSSIRAIVPCFNSPPANPSV